MIYLFNSAYRSLYTKNILNTLFLQKGLVNIYRYRFKGDNIHIQPTLHGHLNVLDKNEKTVISFINRFGERGYEYIPLRLGKFISYQEDGDRIFFSISLEEYIFPHNWTEFSDNIKQTFQPEGLAKLTDGNPRNEFDGYYALRSRDIFTLPSLLYYNQEAWGKAVDLLKTLQAFNQPASEQYIFSRCEIKEHYGKSTTVKRRTMNNKTLCLLKYGEVYDIHYTYKYPLQGSNQNAKVQMEIAFGNYLEPVVGAIKLLDSIDNSFTISFRARSCPLESDAGLSIKYSPIEPPGISTYGSDAEILFKVNRPLSSWVKIIILLLFFAFCSLFTSDPFPLVKVASSFGQTWAMLWLFVIFGYKII